MCVCVVAAGQHHPTCPPTCPPALPRAAPCPCSELLQQANRQARRVNMFRSKMQSVERWMHQQALPAKLRRRIKTFYAEVRAAREWPGSRAAACGCHPQHLRSL